MNDTIVKNIPKVYDSLLKKCEEIGFTMPSDLYIGPLLKTLVSSKPSGQFLELGTGMSLSLVWMIEGMDSQSGITTVDNDPFLSSISKEYFGEDYRVKIVTDDGTNWIKNNSEKRFDLIFADAWPGKYSELEEILSMLKVGGLYVIDDMNHQPNWPRGHDLKAQALVEYLESRTDLNLTKMNWSTGVIVATKTK